MGRKPAPQPLTLSDPTALGDIPSPSETLQVPSPLSSSTSKSPKSPRSPFRFSQKKAQGVSGQQQSLPSVQQPEPQLTPVPEPQYRPQSSPQHSPQYQNIDQTLNQSLATSPGLPGQHSRPQYQQRTPSADEKHYGKSASRAFFHFSKGPKSASQLPSTPLNSSAAPCAETMSRGPEFPATNSSKTSKQLDNSAQKAIPSLPSKSDLSLVSTKENDAVSSSSTTTGNSSKRGKPKPFAILNRTKSTRDTLSPQDPLPAKLTDSDRGQNLTALKTAPVPYDRSFRDMMSSAARNRSEDRAATRTRDTSTHREEKHSRTQPSSFKDNSGSNFLHNIKNSSRNAADMISFKGFFKSGRGGVNERDPVVDDEHYVLKVINLPLVDQTRRTRISKRLEDSRDKTEFWMPAFPWRAIDYLNYKGCDVEGLYRVPGSGPQVKKWQRKFDEEYDVDLFNQDDLYDINIVGSMLKAWLRELPDELFPKEAQERIAKECAGAETVPELLIEELSNLPPFNYYLLFAITCHLSLLLAHSDKNKMDFRNLCICFQPCMKIDAFCFKFLVCDWRDCWKGCKNEAKYIEEEYLLFDQPPPPVADRKKGQRDEHTPEEQRNVSSSDSKQSGQEKGRLKKKGITPSDSNGSVASHSTVSTALTINSERETPVRAPELTLRPLSPIKPLSPLEF